MLWVEATCVAWGEGRDRPNPKGHNGFEIDFRAQCKSETWKIKTQRVSWSDRSESSRDRKTVSCSSFHHCQYVGCFVDKLVIPSSGQEAVGDFV